MSELVQFETLILELLLIVSLVAVAVRRFRIPYTVALVLAGLVLSLRASIEIALTPELILSILLPPLVFEAAFHLNLDKLQRNLTTIAVLAVPGVVITMLVVGGILNLGAGLPLATALVFGALIAATDPVSVLAIFRRLGAPKRLEVLLEGESLFNDGTAIVIYGLAVGALVTGQFSLIDSVLDFAVIAGGGVAVGLVLGWLMLQLIGRIDDYLVETTLTTVLAFGSYLLAERLGVSGVLAVVTAGLLNGNIGQRGMSPTTRIVVFNFWEYVAFLANSAVFLLIGLDIDLPALAANFPLILWAIAAILVSRAIAVYGLSRIGRAMPERWRHILFWGGLRGAIALALALSLPAAIGPERRTLIVMTFGVVLFTLLAQGLTMDRLLHLLGLITRSDAQAQYELRHARALAARAGLEHMQRLHREGLISLHTWERIQPLLRDRMEALAGAVQEALEGAPELEADEIVTASRESLRAQRSMLANLRRDGVIAEETYEQLVAEADVALDASTEEWVSQILQLGADVGIERLMLLVVQDRDLEAVVNVLAIRNIPSTRIRSTGGFLRQENHLLLVGVAEANLEQAVGAVARVSGRRIEYVPEALGAAGIPLAAGRPVEVHGATVFVLDVERYEAF
jgi:CPA1 family monovalent cation:H+ antiporter